MQKMSLFSAEMMILGAFQTFLCIIYHQKSLERQGFWAFLRYFLLGKYFPEKLEFFRLFVILMLYKMKGFLGKVKEVVDIMACFVL